MTGERQRISMPDLPERPRKVKFPLIATLAPIVLSVAIWLVTGSTFALIFAGLGPATALATYADARRGTRKSRRAAVRRYLELADGVRTQIAEVNARVREDRVDQAPSAAAIVASGGTLPARWGMANSPEFFIALGQASSAGVIDLDRVERPAELDSAVSESIDALGGLAARIAASPVVADARLGIGVYGEEVLTRAYVRSLIVQLAWSLSPKSHWITAPPGGEHSLLAARLPHFRGTDVTSGEVACEFGAHLDPEQHAQVFAGLTEADLPSACGIVVGITEGAVAIKRHPDRDARGEVLSPFTSRVESMRWAALAVAKATREGLTLAGATLPLTVALGPLLATSQSTAKDSLACSVAIGASGPISLDLARHGPHAVIGGTTGSGKSELLISWVLSMAAAYSPDEVTFLLVDFKGGTAFSSLGALAHTVGIISDLDQSGANRALASLRAELRHREAELVRAGVRTIDHADSIPRLVIVVDEFAAMTSANPDLHGLFADLASRGRSLGIHLVLCTQRPNGVVRDSVMANADLRISLRVNNRADSTSVVGVDSAADISPHNRGRALVQVAGGPVQVAQFAIASDADIARIASLSTGTKPVRRPWCEPLPAVVLPADVAHSGPGAAFGLIDLPSQQRRDAAVWKPGEQGHALILGGPLSGKSHASSALTFTSDNVIPVALDVEDAWDIMSNLCDDLDRGVDATNTTVVLDDLDSMVSNFPYDIYIRKFSGTFAVTHYLRDNYFCHAGNCD